MLQSRQKEGCFHEMDKQQSCLAFEHRINAHDADYMVLSKVMRKNVCRLGLNEVSRQ